MKIQDAIQSSTGSRYSQAAIAVGGFALGLTLGAAVFHWPGDSSAWAAWIQAIGAIGAILGAFAVGSIQAGAARKQAVDLEELSRQQRREAIGAIVQGAWDNAYGVNDLVTGQSPVVFMRFLRLPMFTIPESIVALTMIPLHELGSYEAVMGITGVIAYLKRIDTAVANILAIDISLDRDTFTYNIVTIQSTIELVAMHARRALSALDVTVKEPGDHASAPEVNS